MSFVLHCYKLQMTKTVSVKQAKNKLQKHDPIKNALCVSVWIHKVGRYLTCFI